MTHQLRRSSTKTGGDVAQLEEHRTGTPLRVVVGIPGAVRDFSSRVKFQRRLFYGVPTPPCEIACINISVHVKDPVVRTPPCAIACIINICAHDKHPAVVHVGVWWIQKTLKKTPSTHRRLGIAILSQLAFPGESNPNFPLEKSD